MKVVVVIGARDEVHALRETVHGIISACNAEDIARLLIFLAPNATEDCRKEVYTLAAQTLPIPVLAVHEQNDGFATELQQLLREQSDASHAIFWPSDLCYSPQQLAQMIAQAKQNPGAIITLSRLMPGGSLPKDGGAWLNLQRKLFSKLVRLLYFSRQTDPHHGITLFPIRDFVCLNLKEKHMAFLIEYTLCFERMGLPFVEIPCIQQARIEGKSNMTFARRLRYLAPVLRLRFCRQHKIFRGDGYDET